MSGDVVSKPQGRIGSVIVSALFVVAALVTFYDTTTYSDRDSQVFPQAVAIILLVTAGLSLVMQFLKPSDNDGFGTGSWWRRCLLVATMFLTCLAMPVVGFLPAAAIAFAGGLIAAMHDRWTRTNMLLYSASGVVIMVAFYALFKYLLLVPLP